MNDNLNLVICVTASGRRVELIQTLRADAASLGLSPLIIALDSVPSLSAACQKSDAAEIVRPCSHPEYLQNVISSCERYNVKILIPTTDLDLQVLADNQDKLKSKGIATIISSPRAIKIARDKLLTCQALLCSGVPVPVTQKLKDALLEPEKVNYPAIVKPLDGSNSAGVLYLNNQQDLLGLSIASNNYLIQDRCIGPEYTVNVYVDSTGKLRCAIPHLRLEVRGGEVSKARTERRAELTTIAHKIVAAVPGLRGPFCFQAILTNSGPKVFEINARFGGGYPLAHAAGATFGKWLIEEALGLPCTAHDEWQDGLLMLRYDSAVFTKS